MIEIKNIDPTVIQLMNFETVELGRKLTTYKCEFWKPGPRGKVRKEYDKDFVSGSQRTGWFLYAGFKNRIKEYCEVKGLEFRETGEELRIEPVREPGLAGVEIRDYQLEAIKSIIEKQRGIVHAATRSGKSIIAIGAASCFPKPKLLYLAPSIDIVNEIHGKFVECGFKACKLGGGQKDITEDIVVSTLQTYVRLDLIKLSNKFDIIFCDEIHLSSEPGSALEKILSKNLSIVRVGFTASIPTEPSKKLTLQGLFGDKIMELSVKDGIEKHGVLAKPRIELLAVSESKEINLCKTYHEIYDLAICRNKIRNRLIAKYAKTVADENGTVLIFCVNLIHIELLSKELDLLSVEHEIVEGKVSGDDRTISKEKMKSGKLNVIISSNCWAEGVTLPALSHVINASGMKSESRLLQKMGRGLGKVEGKEEIVLVDFLDPYKHLAQHSIARLCVYKNMGWL